MQQIVKYLYLHLVPLCKVVHTEPSISVFISLNHFSVQEN